MAQEYVEQALGRVLTDAEFRDSCSAAPEASLRRRYGSHLSTAEMDALVASLKSLSQRELEDVGARLDARIRRADLRGSGLASTCDLTEAER